MAGCGGCGPEGCNGPCSTRERPRDGVSLAEALARVIVDNRVIARTVELYEAGVVTLDDIVVLINTEKAEGRL